MTTCHPSSLVRRDIVLLFFLMWTRVHDTGAAFLGSSFATFLATNSISRCKGGMFNRTCWGCPHSSLEGVYSSTTNSTIRLASFSIYVSPRSWHQPSQVWSARVMGLSRELILSFSTQKPHLLNKFAFNAFLHSGSPTGPTEEMLKC